MKQHEATTTILNAWVAAGTGWAALSGGVAFVFDNESAAEATTYARVGVRHAASEMSTIGGSSYRNRRTGSIDVKLLGPANAGRITLDQLAQHVRTIYERRRLSFVAGDDIVCAETSSRDIVDDPLYWVLLISTRFWFYEAG